MILNSELDLDATGMPRRVAVAVDVATFEGCSHQARRAIAARLRQEPAITVALGGSGLLPPEIAERPSRGVSSTPWTDVGMTRAYIVDGVRTPISRPLTKDALRIWCIDRR